MAVHGGICEVRDFVHVKSCLSSLRPWMAPRPSLRNMWLWKTKVCRSLSGLALQLRKLQAVLRWDQLSVRPPRGPPIMTATTDNGTSVTKELLARRDLDPDGLRSEYLLKVNRAGGKWQPSEKSRARVIASPVYTPAASTKTRSSKSIANQMIANVIADEEGQSQKVEDTSEESDIIGEHWVDERHLPIWHMRQFSEFLEKRRQQEADASYQRRLLEQQEQRLAKFKAAEAERKKRNQSASRVAMSVASSIASSTVPVCATISKVPPVSTIMAISASPVSSASPIVAPVVLPASQASLASSNVTWSSDLGLTPTAMPASGAGTAGQRLYLIQVPGQASPMLAWLPQNASRAAVTLPGHQVSCFQIVLPASPVAI